MKNLSIISILLVSCLAYACSTSTGKENKMEDPDLIPVEVLPLVKGEVSSAVNASGQFTTHDETSLAFKTGGVIEKVFVKEGDAIRKGQLLASLNLTEINAQVAQASLALEKAKRDFERVTNLYKDSVVTLEQFQNAKTGLNVASQQFDAAEFNRKYSEIRAINDGVVLKKMYNEGQVISPGTAVLQTNGERPGNWVLKVSVSDKDWSLISLGDQAWIQIDPLPGEKIAAEVLRKSGGADPYTGAFAIELKIIDKTPGVIASGLFGKATILPSRKKSGWTIPYEALLDGDAESGYVFVTNDMKTALKKQVVIESIERNQIIISKGLEEAKGLIISGSAYLRDQSSIRVIEHTLSN